MTDLLELKSGDQLTTARAVRWGFAEPVAGGLDALFLVSGSGESIVLPLDAITVARIKEKVDRLTLIDTWPKGT